MFNATPDVRGAKAANAPCPGGAESHEIIDHWGQTDSAAAKCDKLPIWSNFVLDVKTGSHYLPFSNRFYFLGQF